MVAASCVYRMGESVESLRSLHRRTRTRAQRRHAQLYEALTTRRQRKWSSPLAFGPTVLRPTHLGRLPGGTSRGPELKDASWSEAVSRHEASIWVDRDGRLAARAMPEERLMARIIAYAVEMNFMLEAGARPIPISRDRAKKGGRDAAHSIAAGAERLAGLCGAVNSRDARDILSLGHPLDSVSCRFQDDVDAGMPALPSTCSVFTR